MDRAGQCGRAERGRSGPVWRARCGYAPAVPFEAAAQSDGDQPQRGRSVAPRRSGCRAARAQPRDLQSVPAARCQRQLGRSARRAAPPLWRPADGKRASGRRGAGHRGAAAPRAGTARTPRRADHARSRPRGPGGRAAAPLGHSGRRQRRAPAAANCCRARAVAAGRSGGEPRRAGAAAGAAGASLGGCRRGPRRLAGSCPHARSGAARAAPGAGAGSATCGDCGPGRSDARLVAER